MTREPERFEITVNVSEVDAMTLKLNGSVRRLGESHPETMRIARDKARALRKQPELRAEAIDLYMEILRILHGSAGFDDPFAMEVIHEAADLIYGTGDLVRAEQMAQDLLERRERVLGRGHADTLAAARFLGRVLVDLNRAEEAEALLYDVRERRPEADRGDLNELAGALRAGGRLDEAAAMYRTVLAEAEREFGRGDDRTLTARNNLAATLFQLGAVDESIAMFRGVLAALPPSGADEMEASARNNLATVLFQFERYDEAEVELRRAVLVHGRHLGPGHPATVNAMENLARVLQRTRKTGEARRLAQQCMTHYSEHLPAGHPKIRQTRELLDSL